MGDFRGEDMRTSANRAFPMMYLQQIARQAVETTCAPDKFPQYGRRNFQQTKAPHFRGGLLHIYQFRETQRPVVTSIELPSSSVT